MWYYTAHYVRCSLAVGLLIMAAGLLPAAAQTDTLTVGHATGAPGQMQWATVDLSNTQKIAGLQLALAIDAQTVIIDTVDVTDRTGGMMVQWNAQNGKILMIDFALKHMIEPGAGPILKIRYYVASTAADKDVTIHAKGVVLSNPDGRAVPVAVRSGRFTIKSETTAGPG